MNKLIILFVTLGFSASGEAITFKEVSQKSNVSQQNISPQVQDWMRTKTGYVSVFDKVQKSTTINGEKYRLDENFHSYDGVPQKGGQVKFNTDKDGKITELWVMR